MKAHTTSSQQQNKKAAPTFSTRINCLLFLTLEICVHREWASEAMAWTEYRENWNTRAKHVATANTFEIQFTTRIIITKKKPYTFRIMSAEKIFSLCYFKWSLNLAFCGQIVITKLCISIIDFVGLDYHFYDTFNHHFLSQIFNRSQIAT